jgi:hypothetical protein
MNNTAYVLIFNFARGLTGVAHARFASETPAFANFEFAAPAYSLRSFIEEERRRATNEKNDICHLHGSNARGLGDCGLQFKKGSG